MTTYQDIRDRIAQHARTTGHTLRWIDQGRTGRTVLVYDQAERVIARCRLPFIITPTIEQTIHDTLAPAFGPDWNKP